MFLFAQKIQLNKYHFSFLKFLEIKKYPKREMIISAVNFAINKDKKSLKMLNKIVEKRGAVISAIIYFISNLEI